jgi:predicted nuclease with TOPRIM domain
MIFLTHIYRTIDELNRQLHDRQMQLHDMGDDFETQLNNLHRTNQDLLAEKSRLTEMLQQNHNKVAQEQIQTQALQQEYVIIT